MLSGIVRERLTKSPRGTPCGLDKLVVGENDRVDCESELRSVMKQREFA